MPLPKKAMVAWQQLLRMWILRFDPSRIRLLQAGMIHSSIVPNMMRAVMIWNSMVEEVMKHGRYAIH
jgi:hypothetical protein